MNMRDAVYKEYENHRSEILERLTENQNHFELWNALLDRSLIPELPEGVEFSTMSEMWPGHLKAPLNKALINDLIKAFVAKGWIAERMRVEGDGVSFTLNPPHGTGLDGIHRLWINVNSFGEGEHCKLVKVSSIIRTTEREEAVYELVCDEGAAEMEHAKELLDEQRKELDKSVVDEPSENF